MPWFSEAKELSMAVVVFDHGAAVDAGRDATFRVHYPPRLIIEVGSPTRVPKRSGRTLNPGKADG
jgi:hypothetical protein